MAGTDRRRAKRTRGAAALAVLWLATTACPVAPLPEDAYVEAVRQAARDERSNRYAAAADGYERAATLTGNAMVARTALYRAGQSAERAGESERALAIFARLADESPGTPEAGRSLHDAGRLLLRLGREEEATARWVRLVRQEPGNALVEVALRRLLHLFADRGETERLEGLLGTLLEEAGEHPVQVGLRYFRAQARASLGRIDEALADIDAGRAACPYPDCSFWDDLPWEGAEIARAAGRPGAAVAYLEALQSFREEAWFTGSYYSIYFDDARVLEAEIRLEDLQDPAGAAAAFLDLRRVRDTTLADDGLFRAAELFLDRLDQPERGCDLLRELLEDYPESNRRSAAGDRLGRPPCGGG